LAACVWGSCGWPSAIAYAVVLLPLYLHRHTS